MVMVSTVVTPEYSSTHTHTEKKSRDRQILHMYTLLLQTVLVYRYLLRGDKSGERSAQFTFI